jgi:Domain of unknown function (DUF5667)
MFNRKTDKLDEILNECLGRLVSGCEDIDECLAAYPEYAEELRPMLMTAMLARKAASVEPSPEFRVRARYQFNAAVSDATDRKKRRPLAWQHNWALAASLSLMMILSGGGIVAASGESMPDSPLYQVKLAVEQAQIFFTPSASAKADLYVKLADKRVAEIINMAKEGNAEVVKSTNELLAKDLSMITNYSANNYVDWGPANNTEGSYSLATSTQVATQTVTQSGAGILGVTSTLTSTTTVSVPETTVPPDKTAGNEGERLTIDPACFAADNFACRFSGESAVNLMELYAVMENAPSDVRQAILETIQVLVGGYNEAYNAGVEASSNRQ